MDDKGYKLDFGQSFEDGRYVSDQVKLKQICNDAIIKANEKANNLEPWVSGPSSYLIDQFLTNFDKKHRKSVLNFKVEQKFYNCSNLVSEDRFKSILEKYLKDKNKKNAYKFSDNLSKKLFAIIIDYIDYITNELSSEIKIQNVDATKSLDAKDIEFDTWDGVPSIFTSRFKNFERDLLVNEYSSKKEDIDNKGMRTLIYGSSQLFYVSSNQHFFIMSYSPANEQYYNQKIKEVNKAPNFSFFIYSKEVEEFFVTNFELLNNLHKNFMQFTYLSDTNQNIVNAMGEASLISQYWYTESVNRILKDHDKELKKSKDSKLLGEYIIRYILAAEINGVDFIEVYPFDRVFMFSNSIFDGNKNNEELSVFEGLLESKVPHEEILDKKFLGGRTQYSYEWEREKTGFNLDRFDPSKKKIHNVRSNIDGFNVNESDVWENDYNKDDETVINNLLVAMLKGDNNYNKTQMLEYKSKYSIEGITYLYSSGTNLKAQIKSLYNLQEYYLKNLTDDETNGIKKGFADILFNEKHDNYFDNVKVILFAYTPDDEKSNKGFTLVVIANDDVPKAQMEQKSEKDDLHTALKLLINQHFTIDQRYKEQSLKEQSELIDILTQTKHSIKNSFENFSKNDDLNTLKEKVLAIIEQDRIQMIEQGRDAVAKKYEYQQDSTLENSVNFIKSLFSSTEGDSGDNSSKTVLSKKFSDASDKSWDFFAQEIFKLQLEKLNQNRIYTIKWKDKDGKIDLIIDFNELQNFSLEWKESLFNDAIYVMLKNACEHSIETYTKNNNHREIFLDVYISETGDGETLNIEFTNSTGKVCKEVFDHINSATTVKNNTRKENSTGIGVVTIRKRLDVTYGLEKANVKFTLISEDKIKSLLYFPIKSLHNDLVFLNPNDCNNKSKVLYLEDDPEYYKKNVDLLKSKAINCAHEVRFQKDYKYETYNLMLTDLNIFGPDSDEANASNGESAIQYFIKKNPKGVVIILSSDNFTIPEESLDQYTIATEPIDKLSVNQIYILGKKVLDTNILDLIASYLEQYEKNDDSQSTELVSKDENENKSPKSTKKETTMKKFDDILDFNSLLDKEDILSINDVDCKLFKVQNEKKDIIKWLKIEIEEDDILTHPIINSEIPNIFITKLIVFNDKKDFILKHELLRRNILYLQTELKKDSKKTLKYANETFKYLIPKNGIFGKISHDILNKMPEFSIYTKSKIEELKKLNEKVRVSFKNYFDDYLESANNDGTFKDIEKDFNHLQEELQILQNEAESKNTHLGTDRKNLVSILNKLNFIRSL